MNKLEQLTSLGQAVWLDFIRRSFLTSGGLQALINQGLRGMTSNPTIFEKAIAGSQDYDGEMRWLAAAGKTTLECYEYLAIHDIRMAADLFRPVFEQTHGDDGYVSLEVSPNLADDTAGTLAEARRLFRIVNRPNVMIKIPATPAGLPAIEEAIAEGINVNVTLIFALDQYEAVVNAYLKGLERRAAAGGDLRQVASVASFFVSRIDTAVDAALQQAGNLELQGKLAIASARAAYTRFQALFSGRRWQALAQHGARKQRPLWASTGAKNPNYPDTLYVDTLIVQDTVNTLPPATLAAFQEHGQVALMTENSLSEAQAQIAHLAEVGVDLREITDRLLQEGVQSFAASFEALLNSIDQKRRALAGEVRRQQPVSANLQSYQAEVEATLAEMERQQVIPRLWVHDHTLWKPEPAEITNRLGWLHILGPMETALPELWNLARTVHQEGYTHALLLGMGGSSLAPEVLRKVFGVQPGYLDLAVLDSTDPSAVLGLANRLDLRRTLFIVSTKSGGTVETFSFFRYFYNQVADRLGKEQAGQHFIAITDPSSKLAEMARELGFRHCLLNDPHIGGRYSALSFFGLAPAALTGLDLEALILRAQAMQRSGEITRPSENPAAVLGAILGTLALRGRDKVTLVTSPAICTFGDWVEQLIAESTGKEGRGILPVVGEVVGGPAEYGQDRLYVYLRLKGDHTHDLAVLELEAAGQPVVRIELEDVFDLGGQFFLWELATAVAGWRLGINPFDQPNVESAKVLARQMVAAYQQQGKLPQEKPALQEGQFSLYGTVRGSSLAEALQSFLAQAQPGAYLAIQAYIPPSDETDAALLALRTRLRQVTRLAVTTGYGPRFLHSTGQLHKGDAGKGLFWQITSTAREDAAIPDTAGEPDSSISFGVLKLAQAQGDRQALEQAGRAVLRCHIEGDLLVGLERLLRAI